MPGFLIVDYDYISIMGLFCNDVPLNNKLKHTGIIFYHAFLVFLSSLQGILDFKLSSFWSIMSNR